MKIVLVTTWYPSKRAPGSGVFVEKDAHLLAREHDVHVVHLITPALLAPEDADDDAAASIRITRIPMSTRDPLSILRAGRKVIPLLAGADLLHTQAFSALLPLLGRRVLLPWVHTEHWSALSNPDSLPPLVRPGLPVLARLLRRPDVVTAVCEYLAAPIRRVRPSTVHVVPCIVEAPSAVTEPPRDPSKPRLIAVGGLNARKDPLCAVEAVALLHRDGFPAELTWVGDGDLRDAVARRATELGIDDAVQITGTVDAGEVRRRLRQADMFLLPTLAENFCVSAAEAVVEGRPAVVGINGGQRDYLTPVTGRLISAQTPENYAAAVRELWEATAAVPAMEIAATIGDAFSPDAVLSGYGEAYRAARRRRR